MPFRKKKLDYTENYTGGSKTKNHVGIGIVTGESAVNNLSLCISISTAGVYALLEAVKKVITG